MKNPTSHAEKMRMYLDHIAAAADAVWGVVDHIRETEPGIADHPDLIKVRTVASRICHAAKQLSHESLVREIRERREAQDIVGRTNDLTYGKD